MRIRKIITLLWAAVIALAVSVQADACQSLPGVMLDIRDGETAFVVDAANSEDWGDLDSWKTVVPVDTFAKNSKRSINTITSQMILNKITVGNRQVSLKQQFRGGMADTPDSGSSTAEVLNSLRGGWSPVPVRVNSNCPLAAINRNRKEPPAC